MSYKFYGFLVLLFPLTKSPFLSFLSYQWRSGLEIRMSYSKQSPWGMNISYNKQGLWRCCSLEPLSRAG